MAPFMGIVIDCLEASGAGPLWIKDQIDTGKVHFGHSARSVALFPPTN
jgi:hypothetical protein